MDEKTLNSNQVNNLLQNAKAQVESGAKKIDVEGLNSRDKAILFLVSAKLNQIPIPPDIKDALIRQHSNSSFDVELTQFIL